MPTHSTLHPAPSPLPNRVQFGGVLYHHLHSQVHLGLLEAEVKTSNLGFWDAHGHCWEEEEWTTAQIGSNQTSLTRNNCVCNPRLFYVAVTAQAQDTFTPTTSLQSACGSWAVGPTLPHPPCDATA